ncbi:MAG: PDZ domain-containing protein [Sedimentisphaerales bacterium]|nr:PDZ domain-containing protein [Sedimentisphaerales bacterium]
MKGVKLNVRKVLIISKLAIILLLAYIGGQTLLTRHNSVEIFAPSSAGGTEAGPMPDANAQNRETTDDFSVIVERDIFGTTGQSPAAVASDVGVLPSAGQELGFELVGTVFGNPAISRAIIKNTKTKDVDLYRSGQNVAGASILSIQANAIILLHDGRRKVLTLKTAETNLADVSCMSGTNVSQATSAKPYLPASRIPAGSDAPKSRIGYIEEILSKAAIEPYVVNDRVEGLKITGLEEIPMAETIGLKNGDIVRSVNGQNLTSLQKAFQVFQKARSQPSLNMQLSRGDQTKEISFDLK